jgi:cytochrome c551/c552
LLSEGPARPGLFFFVTYDRDSNDVAIDTFQMKWKIALVAVLALFLVANLYERLTLAKRGEDAFTRLGCGGCHFSGGGPNLTHVARKHNAVMLQKFIRNPQVVYRERDGQPLNPGYMLMPNMNATDNDARAIIAYLNELNKQQ